MDPLQGSPDERPRRLQARGYRGLGINLREADGSVFIPEGGEVHDRCVQLCDTQGT